MHFCFCQNVTTHAVTRGWGQRSAHAHSLLYYELTNFYAPMCLDLVYTNLLCAANASALLGGTDRVGPLLA